MFGVAVVLLGDYAYLASLWKVIKKIKNMPTVGVF